MLDEDIQQEHHLANLAAVSDARRDRRRRASSRWRTTTARALNIRCAGVDQQVVNLSGGNQQKVVLGKWLFAKPEVLILDEPTRGIDVGAKYEIYTIIDQLASEGKGILMISSEMPELLGMCDRIYVMNEGRFVAEFPAAEASQEKIMRAIVSLGEQRPCRLKSTRSPPAPAGRAAAPAHAGFLKNNLREYGMLISLVAIMVLFQVLTDGTLMRPLNLTNLVLQNSYIVIMALGMLLVIVAGHIDLSVGSVCGFVGALAAVLMVRVRMALRADLASSA